jgi:hypothetical protein
MKTKYFGYIGIALWIMACIIIGWLMYFAPEYKPTTIRLNNTFLCKKNGDTWLQVDRFREGEELYICSQIESNVQEFHKQIQIRIYEGKRETFEHPIYYDNTWVLKKDVVIPLRVFLYSGNYTVEISSGRKILDTIRLEIQK